MANEIRVITTNGQKMCIQGVTRYTTCDDVIEMLFYHSGTSVELDSYALFESSYGVERMLYGKESILKVTRSWGVDRDSFTLLLRKADTVKSNMVTLSQVRRKLRKIRSEKETLSSLDNYTIKSNLNELNDKTVGVKDIKAEIRSNEKQQYSKFALMKRFLSDVMLQKKKYQKEKRRVRVASRTPGDGCSICLDSRYQIDKDIPSEHVSDHHNCFDDQTSGQVDGREDKYCFRRYNSYLNAAFVEADDSRDLSSELMNESSDDESAYQDDSEVASLSEFERNIDENSDVDLEDESDLNISDIDSPFCNAENTVIKCERIINMFDQKDMYEDDVVNDDTDMESFMNTLVYGSDSDEGLSSFDSYTDA